MTRKLLTALETQLLHPPPWRALQLGVVALHSSGVRLVSVGSFFFWLFGFFFLFCFVFSLRPALASLTPRASAAACGVAPAALPRSRTSCLSLCCSSLDAGAPFSAPLNLFPPPPRPTEEQGGLWI